MNLLAKNWMGLLITATFFIFSCEDPSEIGLELAPDALSVDVIFEEIELSAENVFVDSIRTQNNESLLVGSTTSDIFGTTTSIAHVQLTALTTALANLEESDDFVQSHVFDSAVLTLEYNYVNTPDISQEQTISVHKLDDHVYSGVYYLANFETPILPSDPDDVFTFTVDGDSLNDALANFEDTISYTLNLKLSETLGTELYDIIQDENTTELVRDQLKGIALVGGETNTVMVGFSPRGQTKLRLHYHIIEDDLAGNISVPYDSLFVDFSFVTAGARYNQINTDRSSSLIGNHISDNLEEFDTEDGLVYLMPGSGIFPKISLQPLKDFYSRFDPSQGEFIQISRAEFVIQTSNTDTLYQKNPVDLRFMFMNDGQQVNTTGLATQDINSTLVLQDVGYQLNTQQALLAGLNEETFQYNGVMTYFVQLIEDGTIDVDKLALMPSNFNTMDRSVFEIDVIKLRIYYAVSNR